MLLCLECHGDHLHLHSFPTRRSSDLAAGENGCQPGNDYWMNHDHGVYNGEGTNVIIRNNVRSEEHTSELQSHSELVCRLLLEKKKATGQHQDGRRLAAWLSRRLRRPR